MTGVLGPILTLSRIERLVRDHVVLWLPTYLRAIEREEAVEADGTTPLVVGSLPLPRSWDRTSGDVDKWPASQLPAVIFNSPGLSDEGTHIDTRMAYHAQWVFSLTVVTSADNDVNTRWLVGLYVAALRALLVQHPPMSDDIPIRSCRWQQEAYSDLPFSRSGSLMAGATTFTVDFEDVVSARHGLPFPPPDDPVPDPGVFPSVQTTDLEIERS